MTVSINLVNRTIRILDKLAKELENKKFKLQCYQDNGGSFVIAVKDNENITFRISEGYKYQPIKNELRSELDKLLYSNKEPIPTGKLILSLFALETNITKSWSDGIRPLEDQLATITNGFDSLLNKQKQRRLEDAIKADQRSEHEKIFAENESKRYAEKLIFDQAVQESQTYIEHKNLETYLNCLEENYLNEYGLFNEATLLWFSTARKVAELHSPVSRRLKLLNSL